VGSRLQEQNHENDKAQSEQYMADWTWLIQQSSLHKI